MTCFHREDTKMAKFLRQKDKENKLYRDSFLPLEQYFLLFKFFFARFAVRNKGGTAKVTFLNTENADYTEKKLYAFSP